MRSNRLTFERSIAFSRRIEEIVPGGAHTYSRGPDQFPLESPNGIVSGKGARVRDVDGNELVDWSMALTSVSLGHAWPSVNAAVIEAIGRGVNFQRPTSIELEAAEAMIALTGDDMVKFARHGSAVTTAAVKLARAFTGRSIIAVAADHPFFSFDDWFIGTTPCDFGVPPEVARLTVTFPYGDLDALRALFARHPGQIACLMLEPVKFDMPPPGYLVGLRELCDREGALLILDEMVTGLKIGMPGAQSRFGVRADISTWGKGIANGFAIAALTGRRSVMSIGGLAPEGARKLFMLSSTHGGESVGFAAMLATLAEFRSRDIVGENAAKGAALRRRLEALFARMGLSGSLSMSGFDGFQVLGIAGPDGKPDAAFRTLFMQEMIARGVLFQGLFYPTPSHGLEEIDQTVAAAEGACEVYRDALARGTTDGILRGPAVKPVFRKFL